MKRKKKIESKILRRQSADPDFSSRYGNGTDGRSNANSVNFTQQLNTTRLEWGWPAAWQINVDCGLELELALTITTTQHG
jgi:hypothetical protein